MKLKKDISYEMLLQHGFEAVTSEFQETTDRGYAMVSRGHILRVTKFNKELLEKKIMMTQVILDEINSESIPGAISVYWMPLHSRRIIDAFFLKPCDSIKK